MNTKVDNHIWHQHMQEAWEKAALLVTHQCHSELEFAACSQVAKSIRSSAARRDELFTKKNLSPIASENH